MRRNFRYSLPPFLAPAVYSVTSELTPWPATNALLDFVPRRPWKSGSTAQQTLILDFGTSTIVEALLIAWTNYPRIHVAGSNTAGSGYVDVVPSGYDSDSNGLLIGQDPDLLRRRLIVDMTGGLFNYRYLRLIIDASLATDDGASFYSTGAITCGALLKELPDALSQMPSFTFPNPETIAEFPTGALDVNELSVPRVSMSFGGPFIHESAASHIRAIDRIGSKPMIVYPSIREGGGSDDTIDPSKAYLMRRRGDAGRAYGDIPEIFTKQVDFDEVI